MKQQLIEWYIRNKFQFWKIENSKGKVIADNTPNKEHSAKDENGSRLTLELDALERLPVSERYSVHCLQKNGQHDWQTYPFVTHGANSSQTQAGLPVEMAMMLGRMQAEKENQSIIWQLQREKEERERKEEESGGGLSDFAKMLKPLAPAIISSIAPMAIKGVFDLAGKSPQILSLLEKITANPTVQEGITQIVTAYFTNQANGTGTDIEKIND